MPYSKYMIVDTSAFIKNVQLQDIGENAITIPEVVQEVTSKRQIKRLVALPYDLQLKEPDPDSIKLVTEFSKKTGDYPSLSATDIKVIALTCELHKQHVGVEGINTEPISRQISYINHSVLTDKEVLAGFYTPSKDKKKLEGGSDALQASNTREDPDCGLFEDCNSSSDVEFEEEESYYSADEEGDNEVDHTANIMKKIEDEESTEDDENEDSDSDGGEWITPSNVKQAQRKIDAVQFEEKPLEVACVTMDFAMQNVLKQMGLNVVAMDGRLIRELRTFILRCYACFKTTSIMTKQFCPNCGYKTLKKVAVSVDNEGRQKIHINLKRPLTARGKKYSLPTFKGGKHANNPVICEDQPLPDQRPTRLGRMKTNALDPDYIAGMSPFAIHDINSKSAMLGIRTHANHSAEVKYWMHKNPNVVKRRPKK